MPCVCVCVCVLKYFLIEDDRPLRIVSVQLNFSCVNGKQYSTSFITVQYCCVVFTIVVLSCLYVQLEDMKLPTSQKMRHTCFQGVIGLGKGHCLTQPYCLIFNKIYYMYFIPDIFTIVFLSSFGR